MNIDELLSYPFCRGPTLKWAEFEVGRVVHKTMQVPKFIISTDSEVACIKTRCDYVDSQHVKHLCALGPQH